MHHPKAAAERPVHLSLRVPTSAKLVPRLRDAFNGLWRRPSTPNATREVTILPSAPTVPRPDAPFRVSEEPQDPFLPNTATILPTPVSSAPRQPRASAMLPSSPPVPRVLIPTGWTRPLPAVPGPPPSAQLPVPPSASPGTLLLQSLSEKLPPARRPGQLMPGRPLSGSPCIVSSPPSPSMVIWRGHRRAQSHPERPTGPSTASPGGLGLAFALDPCDEDDQQSLHSALSHPAAGSSCPDPSTSCSYSFCPTVPLQALSERMRSSTVSPPVTQTQHRRLTRSQSTAALPLRPASFGHCGDVTQPHTASVNLLDSAGDRLSERTGQQVLPISKQEQALEDDTTEQAPLNKVPVREAGQSPPLFTPRSGHRSASPKIRTAQRPTLNALSHPRHPLSTRPIWLSVDDFLTSSAMTAGQLRERTSSARCPEPSAQHDLSSGRWIRLWRRTSLSGRLMPSESIRTAKSSLDTVLHAPLFLRKSGKRRSPECPRRPTVSSPNLLQRQWRARQARHTCHGADGLSNTPPRQRRWRGGWEQPNFNDVNDLHRDQLGSSTPPWVPPDPFAPPPEGARVLHGSPSRFCSSSPITQVHPLPTAPGPYRHVPRGGKDTRTRLLPTASARCNTRLSAGPRHPLSDVGSGGRDNAPVQGVPFPLRSSSSKMWPSARP